MDNTAYGTPLEEGTLDGDRGQALPQPVMDENEARAEDIASRFLALMTDPVFPDDLDFSSKYNTDLGEGEEAFQAWAKEASSILGRDLSKDAYDYDIRGYYLDSGGVVPGQGAHLTDRYKKPNHPTFSDESIYHGVDGYEGGYWSGQGFFVGASNLHHPDDLRASWYEREKDVALIDRRIDSDQTARIRAFLDRSGQAGQVLSDAEAYARAEQAGKRGPGEVFMEKIDPRGGNVLGRTALIGVGTLLGTGALTLATKGATLPLFLKALATTFGGIAGGSGGDALALWYSKKAERDVRRTMLRLEADDYTDPEERAADQKVFADWYNEKRIDEARGDNLLGFVTDIVFDMLPYVATFNLGRGALRTMVSGVSGVGMVSSKNAAIMAAAGLGGSKKAPIVAGLQEIVLGLKQSKMTPAEAKRILSGANVLFRRGVASSVDDGANMLMQRALERKINAAFGLGRTGQKVGLAKAGHVALEAGGKVGVVTLARQYPLFQELKEEHIRGVSFDDDGKMVFDENALSMGRIARKELDTYIDNTMEIFGMEVGKRIVRATGLPKLLKPVFEKTMKTGKIGGARAATRRFLTENPIGKHYSGRSKIMRDWFRQYGINSMPEEYVEEWTAMALSAFFDLDKDERGDVSWASNLVDKVFFPVTHPFETLGMAIAFSVAPTASAALGAVRGDYRMEQINEARGISYRIYDAMTHGTTPEERSALMGEIAASREVKKTVDNLIESEGKKENLFTQIFKKLFKPRGEGIVLGSMNYTAETFVARVQAIASEIERKGTATGEAATRQAASQALDEMLVATVFQNVKDKNAARELRDALGWNEIGVRARMVGQTAEGDTYVAPVSGATLEQIGQAERRVNEKREERRRKASEKMGKPTKAPEKLDAFDLLRKYPSMLTFIDSKVNVPADADAASKRQARIFRRTEERGVEAPRKLFEELAGRTPSEAQVAKAVSFILENMGVIQRTGDIGKAREKAEQLAMAIAEHMARNAEGRIILTRSVGEFAPSGIGFFNAYNRGGDIYFSPASGLLDSKQAMAAVFEEEAIESGHKKRMKTTALDITAKEAFKMLETDLASHASGDDEDKKALAVEIQKRLKEYRGRKNGDFETFISAVQELFGKHKRPDGDYFGLGGLADLLSAETLAQFETAAVASLPASTGLSVDFSRQLEPVSGIEKTKAYLGAKRGKQKSALQEAIDTITANLDEKTGTYKKHERSRKAAEAMLSILEKGQKARKSHKETKLEAALLIQSLAYEATTFSESSKEDSEERKEHNFDQNLALDAAINQEIVKQYVAEYGNQMGFHQALSVSRDRFFLRALGTDIARKEGQKAKNVKIERQKRWESFLLGEGGSVAEQQLRRFFMNLATEKDGKKILPKRNDGFAFWKAFDSVHLIPFVRLDEGEFKFINYRNLPGEIRMAVRNNTIWSGDKVGLAASYLKAYLGDATARMDFISMVSNIPPSFTQKAFENNLFYKPDEFFKYGFVGEKMRAFVESAKENGVEAAAAEYGEEIAQMLYHTLMKKTKVIESMSKVLMQYMWSETGFTQVSGERRSSVHGESQILQVSGELAKGRPDNMPAVAFLDGERTVSQPDHFDDSEFPKVVGKVSKEIYGQELEQVIANIGMQSLKQFEGKFYYHFAGQFGPKGDKPAYAMPFYWQPGIEEKAKEASQILAGMSAEARAMFKDPMDLIAKARNPDKLTQRELFSVSYAINGIKVLVELNGNIDDYVSPSKTVLQNIANLVKRQGLSLTDGIPFSEGHNAIFVQDILSGQSGKEGYDGEALLFQSLMDRIASEIGGDKDDFQSYKGHVSTVVDGRRLYIKVNWQVAEAMAKDANIAAMIEYVNAYNQGKKYKDQIHSIVFDSGAKFRAGTPLTEWKAGAAPSIMRIPERALIRSQDLEHDNSRDHEGIIPSQYAGHMAGAAMPHGLKAATLRAEVSSRRMKKNLPPMLAAPSLLVSEQAPPNVVEKVLDNGESVVDTRYERALFTAGMAFVSQTMAQKQARVALQVVGEGSRVLPGYELRDGNLRLPRVRMNISGGRYDTHSRQGYATEKDAMRAAKELVFSKKEFFSDMFMPGEDGRPDYGKFLGHEIDVAEANGEWRYTIPGEVVVENRVPASNYTAHTFVRLSEPVTEKAFRNLNLSMLPDGIRVSKGADFDGDKSFVLMFYRSKSMPGYHGIAIPEFDSETDLSKETDNSVMNRALSLEFLDWVSEGTRSYYMLEGDIPISVFDTLVQEGADAMAGKEFSLNTPEGIGNMSEIVMGATDAIGPMAKTGTVYSILSGAMESIPVLPELLVVTKKGKERRYKAAGISLRNGIYVPSEIGFSNYRSIKRLFDVLLNIPLDDPKDPRAAFLNISKKTIGIAGLLMAGNVSDNDINSPPADVPSLFHAGNQYRKIDGKWEVAEGEAWADAPAKIVPDLDILSTKAGVKALSVMRYMQSPEMRAYGAGGMRAVGNAFGWNSDQYNAVMVLDALNSDFITLQYLLGSHDDSIKTIDEFNQMAGKFVNPNIQLIPSVIRVLEKTSHPLYRLSKEAYEARLAFVEKMPSLAITDGPLDAGTPIQKLAARYLPIRSILGRAFTVADLEAARAKAIQALKDYPENTFTRMLDEGKGRVSLNAVDSLNRANVSPSLINLARKGFSELPSDVQEAFAVHLFHQGRNPSGTYFSGGYVELMSLEMSKRINDGQAKALADTLAEHAEDGNIGKMLYATVSGEAHSEYTEKAREKARYKKRPEAKVPDAVRPVADAARPEPSVAPSPAVEAPAPTVDINKAKEYKGVPIQFDTRAAVHPVHGGPYLVRFHHPEGKPSVILANRVEIAKAFKEKRWTNPRVDGVAPLPADAFSSLNQWFEFLLEHEIQHLNHPKVKSTEPGYVENENAINRAAMAALGGPVAEVPVEARPVTEEAVVQVAQTAIEAGSIDSSQSGLRAALTNPTELAKRKGNLDVSYPVKIKGQVYVDAEAAFQALKPKERMGKDLYDAQTMDLMRNIIRAKLEQHPQLVRDVEALGGISWIDSQSHRPQDANWGGRGRESRFIQALSDAYLSIQAEEGVAQVQATVHLKDVADGIPGLSNLLLDYDYFQETYKSVPSRAAALEELSEIVRTMDGPSQKEREAGLASIRAAGTDQTFSVSVKEVSGNKVALMFTGKVSPKAEKYFSAKMWDLDKALLESGFKKPEIEAIKQFGGDGTLAERVQRASDAVLQELRIEDFEAKGEPPVWLVDQTTDGRYVGAWRGETPAPDAETFATPREAAEARPRTPVRRDRTAYESLSVNKGQGEYKEYMIHTPFPVPGQHGEFNDPNLAGWFRVRERKTDEAARPWPGVDSDFEWQGHHYQSKTDFTTEVYRGPGRTRVFGTFYERDGSRISEAEYAAVLADARDRGLRGASGGYLEIQEIQSELFQKNKGGFGLMADFTPEQAAFLNLMLNDQNWVTVFTQAITQWAQQQGFERVRFPTGETAAKVEGHQVLADRLTELQERRAEFEAELVSAPDQAEPGQFDRDTNFMVWDVENGVGIERRFFRDAQGQWFTRRSNERDAAPVSETEAQAAWLQKAGGGAAGPMTKQQVRGALAGVDAEIQNLKTEGIEKLAPIEAFYENRIGKLAKAMGAETVTDANGNTWREVPLAADQTFSRSAMQELVGQPPASIQESVQEAGGRLSSMPAAFRAALDANELETALAALDGVPMDPTQQKLADAVVLNWAYGESMARLEADPKARIVPYLNLGRDAASARKAHEYAAESGFFDILREKFDSRKAMAIQSGLLHPSAYRQHSAMKQILKETETESTFGYKAASIGNKILRLANSIAKVSERETPKEQRDADVSMSPATYSRTGIEAVSSAVHSSMMYLHGTSGMQRALMHSTRFARMFDRQAKLNINKILRETGSADYIGEDGKKIKATKESKERGRWYRAALEILAETPFENWRDAFIIESWEDAIGELTGEQKKAVVEYLQWIRNTYDVKGQQKGDRMATGLKMFEQFADSMGVDMDAALTFHLLRVTKNVFGDLANYALMTNGEFDALADAYAEWVAEHGKERKMALSTAIEWDYWREANAPHLPAFEGLKTVAAFKKVLGEQREAVNREAAMLGSEWIGLYEGGEHFVPHFYAKKEPFIDTLHRVFKRDPDAMVAHEFHRVHKTYQDALMKSGLVPEDIDLVHDMERYAGNLSRLLSIRAAFGHMATTPDEDGLPMMIAMPAETSGLMTDEIAGRLAGMIDSAMEWMDKAGYKRQHVGIKGLPRLKATLRSINPKKLGYVEVHTDLGTVETVWVRKGEAEKIARHLFNREKSMGDGLGGKVLEALLQLNYLSKSIGISMSLFHPFALMESLVAIDGITGLEGKGNLVIHPVKTWKALRRIHQENVLNPDANIEWIEAGLQFGTGAAPDYTYALQNKFLNKWADEAMATFGARYPVGVAAKAIAMLKTKVDSLLWETLLPSIKLYSANRLFAAQMQNLADNNIKADEYQVRQDVATYVNDAFGGQEWERYVWANPLTRKWLQLLLFAPDWTLSALNISGLTHMPGFNAMLKSPTSLLHAQQRVNNYWPAFALIVLAAIPNAVQAALTGVAKAAAMAGGGEDDDREMNWFSFENEPGRKFSVDITPVMDMLGMKYGKTKSRRTYIRWGKQAYEVFEGWLGSPESAFSTLMGKSSTTVKLLLEQFVGIYRPGWNTPWAGKGFFETLVQTEGSFWDGRAAGALKKFVPMSITPVLDELFKPGTGKPVAFFAPVKLGASSYSAQKDIAATLRIYAEGGLSKQAKAIPDFTRQLDGMVSKVLDAAESNGYNRKKVFSQGISMARGYYYDKFFLAFRKGDEKGMEMAAMHLHRLETKFSNLRESVKKRLDTSAEKIDREQAVGLRDTWRKGMERAAKKRKA